LIFHCFFYELRQSLDFVKRSSVNFKYYNVMHVNISGMHHSHTALLHLLPKLGVDDASDALLVKLLHYEFHTIIQCMRDEPTENLASHMQHTSSHI